MDLTGLTTAFEVWEKLKATYKITTRVNQVHLVRKLVCMELDESKSAIEHLFAIYSLTIQDSRLPPFDEKLKTIFLLMTLSDL